MKTKNKKKVLVMSLALIAAISIIKPDTTDYKNEVSADNLYEEFMPKTGSKTALRDGIYQESAKGFNGDLTVEIKIQDGLITSVKIDEHNEHKTVAKIALTEIPKKIVENQTSAVDSVSGATETSDAIKAAVRACIIRAGGNAQDY
ncbi:MAG: FMN-binding protein [Tissierellia bacterium]|nr:FMN-binding protein [Tissierellia bacterium]